MKKEKYRRIIPPELLAEEIKKNRLKKKKTRKKKVSHAFIQVGIAEYKDRLLRYSDLPDDDGGWIRHSEFRPISFDLVFLMVEGRIKPISGWWTGTEWDGRLWDPEYKVIAWKRNSDWD